MRTSRLHHQLQTLLGQSIPWADQGRAIPLVWRVMRHITSDKETIVDNTHTGIKSDA